MLHIGILLCMFPTMGEDSTNISTNKQGECMGKKMLFSLHMLTKFQF